MIGNFDLPYDKSVAKVYTYTPQGPLVLAGNLPQGIKVWNKPKGINFVYGLLINPGSGGGGGGSTGGGGGGAAGSYSQFIVSAHMVPDTLLVQVPNGGRGGGANSTGTTPSVGTVLFYTSIGINTGTPTRAVFTYGSSVTSMTGGAAGSTAGGAGGSVGAIVTTTATPLLCTAGIQNPPIFAAATGSAGSIGPGSSSLFIGRPQGGASGGGISASIASVGGRVRGPAYSTYTIWNRDLLGGAATGQPGEDGITIFQPTFLSLPGAGGGANPSGTGGRGGRGGIGCGGGGGGAGTTGGAGGDGGDGFVMLVCW